MYDNTLPRHMYDNTLPRHMYDNTLPRYKYMPFNTHLEHCQFFNIHNIVYKIVVKAVTIL